jgi:preprotein translocase subunit SecE
VTLLIGAITRKEAYHKMLIVFGMAAFILYIVILFTRLQ